MMRVLPVTPLLGLLLALLLSPPSVRGEGLPLAAGSAAPVTLAADQLDYEGTGGGVLATGSVVLDQGPLHLESDRLFWQDATSDLQASGAVRLSEPGSELRARQFTANLVTGHGVVADGRVLLRERNFHLAGEELARLGEASYRVTGGRFTTCDGELPDWEFTADEVELELGRYASASHVWFKVRDQRLFYLPYLLFPVKSERESGFLLPRVGYSSSKGGLLSLAWHEVLDRHLDATVYLDYLSRLGLGTGLEFRYLLDGGNRGELLLYHVLGFSDTPDSHAIDWSHDGILPGRVRLAADVQYVSRQEFFSDFGESVDEYSRDSTVSTVLLQRNWEKLNLTGHARYIRDLQEEEGDPLQRLPEVGLDLPFYRLGDSPFFTRTELRGSSFRRDEGDDGRRLFLRQGLGAMVKAGWLELTPEVAAYGRLYSGSAGDDADLLPELSLTMATALQRVYLAPHWGAEAVRHSLEPQVRYLHRPDRDQDGLPLFDLLDRLGPANQVEYALVNRLTGRFRDADGGTVYRELLNLRLSQGYDLDDEEGDDERFSPLRAELALAPTPRTTLGVDASFDVHDSLAVTSLDADLGYGDGRGNGGRLGYSYRGRESGEPLTEYLSLRAETALFAPVYAAFEERYDIAASRSLETLINLEYRSRCWSLFLTLRDRPDSQEVLVGFALAGLGRVGGFGSALPVR